MKAPLLWAALAFAPWAAFALAAPASGGDPAIGRFLIAQPQVSGFLAETVIVLVDHGDHGSLGLIVNRPIGHSVAELLPELEAARGHDEPAFLGGPVAQGQLLLLVRAAAAPPGSAPVLDQVHVSGSRDTLSALLAKPPAGGELRAYVGYAGWAPGQLASEIARGDWLVAPGDAASVFTHDPAGLWKELFDKHRSIRVERRVPAVARNAKSINLSAPWRSAAASSAFRTSASPRSSTR
jgi:putative transcriptional regulator